MEIHLSSRRRVMSMVGVFDGESRRQGLAGHALSARARWLVVSLLAAVTTLTMGCETTRSTTATYQVTPAALDEVRSIGTVQAESAVEIDMDDTTDIMNTFVIDVGEASANAATGRSAKLLQKLGWEVMGEQRPWFVTMKSTKLGALLTIDSFQAVHLASHPGMADTLKNGSIETDTSVIVKVEVYHGNQ
ncbi:hypothetical protein [Nonomuraea sp. NPDC049758]|uniref:hypothetical protein n=1 Tax=Nonomuraea sp. NPDC049758 TaxID=3154360 RepID=UPI003444A218